MRFFLEILLFKFFRRLKQLGEKGVLPGSKLFFHTPSNFAKKALYYPCSGGTYILSDVYETKRNHFEQYLLIHIIKGKMEIHYNEHVFIAGENSFVFLNCNKPHLYKTLKDTEHNWIHFKGNATDEYYDLLFEKNGCVFSLNNNWEAPKCLNRIISMMENERVEEHEASVMIHRILCELEKASNLTINSIEETVRNAVAYIETHYSEELNLSDIANYVRLSPYHFSRVFKKHTNFTPHQYLINYRVNHAKGLLFTSNLTVNEIAFKCGFNSVSHFVTTFKNQTNLSPKKYRDYMFTKKS